MRVSDTLVLQERDRLRAALDGYAAGEIAAILEAHSPGAGAARRKAERVDLLVDMLTDREFARRAISMLSPLGRRLLAVMRRTERSSLAALFLAGQEPDWSEEAVRGELEELLRRGLLLIEERETAGRASLSLAEPASRLWWVWAPEAVRNALPHLFEIVPPLLPSERLPAMVQSGSFALLRRDLYVALRFLKGTGIRLTRAGEPHRTDLRKLLEALQPGQAPARRGGGNEALEGRLLFLIRLLEAAGLARDERGVLRSSSAAEAFLNDPEPVAARTLYEAWLDLDWNEFHRLAHLSVEPWSYTGQREVPEGRQIAFARRAIGAVLAELPDEWIELSAIAALVRRTNPEFLIPRNTDPAANHAAYYHIYGSYYQNRQLQELAYYRGIARAEARGQDRRLRKDRDWDEVEGAFIAQVIGESLWWLGLVDTGFDEPSGRERSGNIRVNGRHGAARSTGAAGEMAPEPRGEGARPIVVRLTELGRQVLAGNAPVSASSASGVSVIVQPSFEVVVLDALARFDLLTKLDAFADAQSLDRAAIYRLTRPALVRGLEAGWTEDQIAALLEAESGQPLPQNVRRTLRDWAREFERIHLHRDATLLEAPDAARLDRWYADPAIAPLLGRRLTSTTALVRWSDAAALGAVLGECGVEVRETNYALDPPQVLDFTGPDTIAILPEDDDPYLRYRLDRFADCQEDAVEANAKGPRRIRYRITPESLARAREEGMRIDEILSLLDYKTRLGLSPDDTVTLRGWSGNYAPFRYAQVRAVELPPTISWGDLVRIKTLRPLILRVIGANLALVSEDRWPCLETELRRRGITMQEQLPEQPAVEKQSLARRTASHLGLFTARDLLDAGESRVRSRVSRGVTLKRMAGRALIEFIEEALDGELPLVIEYRGQTDRRHSTKRVIEPRELEMRGGAYYLRAFCRLRQEERVFRFNGIVGIALADE